MIVIRAVLMVVSIFMACATLWLVYSFRTYGVPLVPTDLKTFVENNGLNLIGDALSGFMSLVTLLVVIASFAQQSAQAKQTVRDMKAQNDLSARIANANYKMSLHEKRLSVYLKMRECCLIMFQSKGVPSEIISKIFSSIEDSEFLFGSDVADYVEELSRKASAYMDAERTEEGFNEDRKGTSADSLETKQWREAQAEKRQIEDWFNRELTPGKLRKLFLPYLKLPETII